MKPIYKNHKIKKEKNKKVIVHSSVIDLNKRPSEQEIDEVIKYLNNL